MCTRGTNDNQEIEQIYLRNNFSTIIFVNTNRVRHSWKTVPADFKMESEDSGIVSWISPTEDKPIKVTKWKVKKGSKVGKGALLCLYETTDKKNLKFKSNMVGTVLELKEDFTSERYSWCSTYGSHLTILLIFFLFVWIKYLTFNISKVLFLRYLKVLWFYKFDFLEQYLRELFNTASGFHFETKSSTSGSRAFICLHYWMEVSRLFFL